MSALHPAGMLHILRPKLLTARTRARHRMPGDGTRRVMLATLGLLFWAVMFGLGIGTWST